MTKISEAEFKKICENLVGEQDVIYKHNPIGTKAETILWMLMSILISYLNLDDKEIPCFPNQTNIETYRNAILFILRERKTENFEVEKYLKDFTENL